MIEKSPSPAISLIMPAKNEARFIAEAIEAVRKADFQDWELVIVDDHSEDDTFNIARGFAEEDRRIRVLKNAGAGKVQGLNTGYNQSTGNTLKFIDADDILDSKFFDQLHLLQENDAFVHSYFITKSNLKIFAKYAMNYRYLNSDYNEVLENLVSLPRCTWTFTRQIAQKVFPLPETLPFEDVWFSLIIKKNAMSIANIGDSLYYYRQHEDQVFQGVLNFSKSTMQFRANRMLKLIAAFEKETDRLGLRDDHVFDYMKSYYGLMAECAGVLKILKSELTVTDKVKVTLLSRFPIFARWATLIKWKIDGR